MRENYKQTMRIKNLQLVFIKNLKTTFHTCYKKHINSVSGGLYISSKLCEFTNALYDLSTEL